MKGPSAELKAALEAAAQAAGASSVKVQIIGSA